MVYDNPSTSVTYGLYAINAYGVVTPSANMEIDENIEEDSNVEEEVDENDGKCFLAVENDKVIGLIMGTIIEYDEYDYLDYKCPKRGEITELIVSKRAPTLLSSSRGICLRSSNFDNESPISLIFVSDTPNAKPGILLV